MIRSVVILVSLVLGLFSFQSVHGEMITLVSGNGAGQNNPDSIINFLAGPTGGPFAGTEAFTSQQFSDARNGSDARNLGTTVNSNIGRNSAWKAQLDSSSAQWISTVQTGSSAGGSALYAMEFTVGPGTIDSATLDFRFLIDNELGDANREGLYLNETEIVGSKRRPEQQAFFKQGQSFTQFDVTSLLNTGTNTLYVYAVNNGNGPAALQFDAKFNITTVPEPTSFLMFGLAVVGCCRRKRRCL